MKNINVILASILFLFVFAVGNISFAEAGKGIIRGNNGDDKERVAQNYNWPQVLLKKEDVGLLPTSPFYFLKEWGRGIRKFFTFDSAKKAELELKYSDEKLIEAAKVVDENCGENQNSQRKGGGTEIEDGLRIQCNEKALQKAFNNYFESQERLAKRLESLDQRDPDNVKLLSKLGERIILHQALFDELISNVPETEQGRAKEFHDMSKPIIRNIRRVGYEPKNIDQAVNKLPYREGVRELKALEILTRLEENLPEEAKKGIETAKEAIQNKLVETGEIQKAKEWKVEQGSSGWISVEGVPVETKAVEKVIEKMEEKAKEVSPVSQRPNIVNLEAVKELKIKIKEAPKVRKVGQGAGDYFPMYNFKVEIDGVIVAEFKEVSGIESETEVVEYKDGDDPVLRKRPGRVKAGNLVLKRGFIADPKLREWYEKVAKGVTERKSISIIVLDRAGQEVMRYNLMDAFPVKFEGGDYSVEEIEFKAEGGVIIGKKITPDKVESGSAAIRTPVACPLIAPDTSKGKEECLKAAKYLDKTYPGCDFAKICWSISPQKPIKPYLDCGPAPGAPGNWRCFDGIWKDVSQCGQIRCLRYDPVCGVDGKTYACGEVDAESCGVKVAYKGECQSASLVPPTKRCQRRPACLDTTPPCLLPEPAEGWCPKSNGEISCTQEWNPVCGTNNKTYSNECMARAAGVDIQYTGECRPPTKEINSPLTPPAVKLQQIQSITR